MRGLANAYGFDVKPWRIVLVIASIMFPPLVAAYIVAWVAIPEAPAAPRSPAELSKTGSGAWAALLALCLAGWLVVEDGPRNGGIVVAAILAVAGVLLWRSTNDGGDGRPVGAAAAGEPTTPPTGAGATGATAAATAEPPWGGPARWGPPADDDASVALAAARAEVAALVPTPIGGTTLDTAPPRAGAPWATPPPWTDDEPPPPRRSRPPVTGITLALIPVALGVALGGDALGWWSTSVATTLALALAMAGVGMVVGAFLGAGRGLALLALALAPSVVISSTFPDVSLRGSWGDRNVVVADVEQARAGFDHGVGKLTVDLQQLPPGATATVPVELGIGEVVVLVPDDVDLVVDAKLGAGELQVGDRRTDGLRIDEDWTMSGGPDASGELTLDLDVGVGHIDVQRLPAPAPKASR